MIRIINLTTYVMSTDNKEIVYLTGQTKKNFLGGILKDIRCSWQDNSLDKYQKVANDESKSLTDKFSFRYINVLSHETLNYETIKNMPEYNSCWKVNLSDCVRQKNLQRSNNLNSYGIANISVTGCESMDLGIGQTFSRIDNDIKNTFWLTDCGRCLPVVDYQDINLMLKKLTDNCTVNFDIVETDYNSNKPAEAISILEWYETVDYKKYYIYGRNLLSKLIVKPSQPVKGVSIQFSFAKLNEDCTDFRQKPTPEQSGYDSGFVLYNLPFTYDEEHKYWVLTLQEYCDELQNLNNLRQTLTLNRFQETEIELIVDKFEDNNDQTENTEEDIQKLTFNILYSIIYLIRAHSGMVGIAWTK